MLYLYNKLVYDYINGEAIDNIDELENDYKFMMEVIRISKDKNIYNLCSDNVKLNYEFVKFIIDTFKHDKDFIDKVSNYYLNNVNDNNINVTELYFILREVFTDYDDDRTLFYNATCFRIYEKDKETIDNLIASTKEYTGVNDAGLGFCYVTHNISCKSEIITKYYAKRFLNDIFYNNDEITLEELIHINVSNPNHIKNVGIDKFIIDFIKLYDSSLSDYVFCHVDLIKNIRNDIVKVLNNWDRFNSDTLCRKDCIFEQEVNDLISKYNVSFDYMDVCMYIDKNLNLPVKLSIGEYDDIYDIDINKLTLVEYECLRIIIKLAKDLYGSSIVDKEYGYRCLEETPSKFSGRILEFKSKTK